VASIPAIADLSPKVLVRFWSKVDKDGPIPAHVPHLGECWVWTASRNQYGAGIFRVNGYAVQAHRLSRGLADGVMPGRDISVMHLCDNRPCVRPSHLQNGTHAENMADMSRKRRGRKPGQNTPRPKRTPRPRLTAEERFWSQVDKNGPIPPGQPHLGPCWLWTGTIQKGSPTQQYRDGGHGVISWEGRRMTTHRVAYTLAYREIPDRLHVRHHCDVRHCVNPAHLAVGTHADNMQDKVLRGRQYRPPKPTEADILQRIRQKADSSAGPDACWPWQGSRHADGSPRYGGKGQLVRRVLHEALRGPIPDGAVVLCLPDCAPGCVNPAHLRAVAKTAIPRKLTVADRFWSKVDKDGPIPPRTPELGRCWLWTAGLYSSGYGLFRKDGRLRRAHQVAYELVVGPIPEGLVILHRCDARHCVNPEHLVAGVLADQSTIRKRLSSRGFEAGGQKSRP
jgi:HNH endonuclease